MSRAIRTRARLLNAAELLFAERGIEGVSLREIAANADVANNSAVQYHFGTKESLLEALFLDRMLRMEDRRGKMLDRLRLRGETGNLRLLLEVICAPHVSLVDANGNRSYARFLSQYLLRYRPPMGHFTLPPEPPAPVNLMTAQTMVREALAYLPDAVVVRRLVISVLAYLATLTNHHSFTVDRSQGESLESALQDTLDQMAVAMAAPVRTSR